MKKIVSITTAALVTACIMGTPISAKPKTPDFLTGKLTGKITRDMNGVKKFFNENKNKFDVASADEEFSQISSKDDELGFRHIKVQQMVDGIPVYGSQYVLHFNNTDEIYAANGKFDPAARNKKFEKVKFINENKAVKIALDGFKYDQLEMDPAAKLYLYDVDGGSNYVPVYEVRVNFLNPEPGDWHVFVNAETGDIVHQYNAIETVMTTGSGKGVLGDMKTLNLDKVNVTIKGKTTTQYQLKDTTRPAAIYTYTAANGTTLPGSLVYGTTNTINDPAAVDAQFYAGVVYDYFKNKFTRNSIDGLGMAIKNTVHYKRSYVNAFWNGTQMVYGDGDGVQAVALSGGLDVIGHEMTHGVDEKEANLVYANQSGALNESLSDTFGCFVEYYGQPAKYDWLMGEDIWTPGTSGDALRSIADPTLYGDPAHMSQFKVLPNTQTGDWGGVHTNSGIPNKAFYNTVMNLSADLSVSMPKAEKIYYRALCDYMTTSTDFAAAKKALSQAAADLYGAGSAEQTAVINAWTSVGVN